MLHRIICVVMLSFLSLKSRPPESRGTRHICELCTIGIFCISALNFVTFLERSQTLFCICWPYNYSTQVKGENVRLAQAKCAWHFRLGHDVPGHSMTLCPYNSGPGTRGLSRVKVGFKYASDMLQVCFEHVSSMLQECFRNASGML